MNRAILYFTNADGLSEFGFSNFEMLATLFGSNGYFEGYTSECGDKIYLIADDISKITFMEQVWKKIKDSFCEFSFVRHRLPINDIVDFLRKNDEVPKYIHDVEGRHDDTDPKNVVYVAVKDTIIEDVYLNGNKHENRFSQKFFDTVWNTYFQKGADLNKIRTQLRELQEQVDVYNEEVVKQWHKDIYFNLPKYGK